MPSGSFSRPRHEIQQYNFSVPPLHKSDRKRLYVGLWVMHREYWCPPSSQIREQRVFLTKAAIIYSRAARLEDPSWPSFEYSRDLPPTIVLPYPITPHFCSQSRMGMMSIEQWEPEITYEVWGGRSGAKRSTLVDATGTVQRSTLIYSVLVSRFVELPCAWNHTTDVCTTYLTEILLIPRLCGFTLPRGYSESSSNYLILYYPNK